LDGGFGMMGAQPITENECMEAGAMLTAIVSLLNFDETYCSNP
jgi:hypothetical protein